MYELENGVCLVCTWSVSDDGGVYMSANCEVFCVCGNYVLPPVCIVYCNLI